MRAEGPELQALLHRLPECPPPFLAEPLLGGVGEIDTAAVAADLLREIAGDRSRRFDVAALTAETPQQRNLQRLRLLSCWLLGHPWFHNRPALCEPALELLAKGLELHAEMIAADKWLADEDRREELVRHCLAALGLRPAGETLAQAEDRLATLDSVEQRRLMKATEAAARRAEQVRLQLEAKAQRAREEAAAKFNRE